MIMGLETEYLLSGRNLHQIGPLPYAQLQRLLIAQSVLKLSSLNGDEDRLWLPNGGLLYIDQDLLEYATPECASPVEALAHVLAGDREIARLAEAYEYFNGGRLDVLVNRGPDGRFVGFHENYAVPPSTYDSLFWDTGWPKEQALSTFVPHLVSRESMCACVQLMRSNATLQDLPVALKYEHIDSVVGEITDESRPILRLRAPDLDEVYLRFEVSCGWRWRDQLALRVLFASTALVLYGVDKGWFKGRNWALADPVEAFASACREPQTTLRLSSGRHLTPLQIQLEMWECVEANIADGTWMGEFAGEDESTLWGSVLEASNTWLADLLSASPESP